MSVATTVLGTAAEILAAVGVEEDVSFYGPFTDEADKAVLTVPMRIMAAWAANDPDTFASIFTGNGSLLMQDNQLTSREEIRAYMAAGFEGPLKGAAVTGWPLYVKYLTPAAAIVVTQGGILMAGDTELAPERQIRATWVIVAQDGQWKLLSHQSCPIKG
jgi:uncharacterized protein (TIGR02246 family)